jgi:predicted nuclease with TOPRIM domain
MKIIKAIKQLKEVMDLQEENEILINEKTYLQTELEEKTRQYDVTKKRCQQYYKLFNAIKEETNKNQNGSVINLQNKIKRLLKEFKL